MKIICLELVMAGLVETCCTGLAPQGFKNPAKNLPTDSLFPGGGLKSRPSKYEAVMSYIQLR
jgi:hypothetical protein